MQLQRLTGLERQKILDELAEIMRTIERLRAILSSDALLMEVVVGELTAVRDREPEDPGGESRDFAGLVVAAPGLARGMERDRHECVDARDAALRDAARQERRQDAGDRHLARTDIAYAHRDRAADARRSRSAPEESSFFPANDRSLWRASIAAL